MRLRPIALLTLWCAVGCGGSAAPAPQAGPPLFLAPNPCVGFDACRSGCEAGAGPTCFELGTLQIAAEMMRRESAGEGSEASARAIYDAAQAEAPRATFGRAAQLLGGECDGGEVVSCYFLGRLCAEGWGGAPDHARSLGLLIQACEGGVAEACTGVGWQYFEGLAVAKDRPQGLKYLERGCAGKHATACHSAGNAYLEGAGVQADSGRGRSLLEQACGGGSTEACEQVEGLGD